MNPGETLSSSIARETGISNDRLLRAFAAVPRERFVGTPPWIIARPAYDGAAGATYEKTANVEALYSNVSVALDADRQLFNGAPATVASWLDALAPKDGERAFHVGCATGYYTAILAELVGPAGSVIGVDLEESFIDVAETELRRYPNVAIEAADGFRYDPGPFDAGLVSTGAAEIPDVWLSRLNDGGRLVVPLTVPLPASSLAKGIVFLIRRDGGHWPARMIGGAIIFPAGGSVSTDAQRRLMSSLQRGNPHDVQWLRRDSHRATESCWLHNETYCLSGEVDLDDQ